MRQPLGAPLLSQPDASGNYAKFITKKV